ncbi:MAG: ABC transporter permease [Ignavibacteriaceae bacterium]
MKQKTSSSINIIGLAIGMACCILILLFVQLELRYDKFQKNADNIYKVLQRGYSSGIHYSEGTPIPLGPTIKNNFPECINTVRFSSRRAWNSIQYGEKRFEENEITSADPSVFEMFTFDFIMGDPKTALSKPNCIVINEEIAKKYFGEEDPYGKVINIGKDAFKITGIVKNLPSNSTLRYRAIISISSNDSFKKMGNHWGNNFAETYIQLNPNSLFQSIETKLKEYSDKNLSQWFNEKEAFILQPFNRIHLYSQADYGIEGYDDYRTVILYTAIASFILLIASINFINISVAQTATRFKEIGLRKVLGAFKKQIVLQFWGEIIFLCLIALALAVLFVSIMLPKFNGLLNRQITFNLGLGTLLGIGGIFFLTSIIAGLFASFLFSKYEPVNILSGKIKIGGNTGFTKSLIVLQFSLSIFFLICTTVMSQQISFIMNQHHVPDNEKIIEVSTNALISFSPDWKERKKNTGLYMSEASTFPLIKHSAGEPGGIGIIQMEYEGRKWDGILTDRTEKYFEMFGIKIKEGRGFNIGEFPSDSTNSVIINETFAKENKINNPIGKTIKFFDKSYSIIGVAHDFLDGNVKHKIPGLVIEYSHMGFSTMYYTVNEKDISAVLKFLENKWHELFPNALFSYSFYDESWRKEYDKEFNSRELLGFVSILAVLLASFGILGLTTLTIAKRTKEIGVRKVLGASVSDIIFLLTKQFGLMVIISSVIASPFAYYYMKEWLNDFVYQIDIKIWVFIFSTVLVLLIVVIMVSIKVIKVAVTNPVESLRNE